MEAEAIPLHFSDTLTNNALTGGGVSLTSFVIGDIPDGAKLSDGTHTQIVNGGTLDVAGWALGSLTITPTNDVNFTLSALVTATDANGYHYTLPATELVTVDPAAPTVSPVAEIGGVGQPIDLDLGTTVSSLPGDANSLASLVVSTIPVGATLSDDRGNSFLATGSGNQVDVHNWDLSHLTITPADATSFVLNVAAVEQDAEGNLSLLTTGTEAVTVNGLPVIGLATGDSAQTIGVGQADAIAGLSLSETGNTTAETFTVTLTDNSNGQLSAATVGDGDTAVVTTTASGTVLTITGSLGDVNSDLATLTDNNATAGPDQITVTASDSFHNSAATPQTIDVTVNGLPVIGLATGDWRRPSGSDRRMRSPASACRRPATPRARPSR